MTPFMTSTETTLIVLRGPSGSGKSSVAQAIRSDWGRPMAWIEQDYLRRIVLKEKDVPNGKNIELIKRIVTYAFERSFDVVLEGILNAGRYSGMLEDLIRQHPRNNFFFYFDISFEETLRRHEHKRNKDEFGEKEMREWYQVTDPLGTISELTIPQTNTLEQTAEYITAVCQNRTL